MDMLNRALGIVMLGLVAGPLPTQEPTAREIMERFRTQDRTHDSSVELTMTLISASGGRREREVTEVTKTDADGNRKQLIRFLSPADIAGTGFLSIEHSDRDDDTWLYLPAMRRVRRIASSDKTDRFVGTEFTYEDLESEDLDAHRYTLLGPDQIDGIDAWIVEAVATDPSKIRETGYSKREMWISTDHHLLVQVKYYDDGGAQVKLLTAGDIRQVPGTDRWRAYRVTMENLQNGRQTVLEFSDYEIDQGVPDEYFSERYLQRGR